MSTIAGVLAVLLTAGAGGYLLFQPGAIPAPAPTPAPSISATPSASATAEASRQPTPESASPTPSYALRQSVPVGSVANFRDVSADGLPLDDGARMAIGLVYRSGKLTTLSKADSGRLSDAGLSDIYDLRTPYVARRSPDPRIQGAAYHLVNIYAVERTPTLRLKNVAAAIEYMRGLNRAFVSNAEQRQRIALVLEAIAAAEKPVLVHCSEGKDRTGWISALLQLIAGAERETVFEQYLLSNQERAAEIARSYAAVKKSSGAAAAEIDKALKTVDASYLAAGLSEVEARYGSLDAYLSDGLDLDQATLDALRTKLRVEAR